MFFIWIIFAVIISITFPTQGNAIIVIASKLNLIASTWKIWILTLDIYRSRSSCSIILNKKLKHRGENKIDIQIYLWKCNRKSKTIVKGVQCCEIFKGIALKNRAFYITLVAPRRRGDIWIFSLKYVTFFNKYINIWLYAVITLLLNVRNSYFLHISGLCTHKHIIHDDIYIFWQRKEKKLTSNRFHQLVVQIVNCFNEIDINS